MQRPVCSDWGQAKGSVATKLGELYKKAVACLEISDTKSYKYMAVCQNLVPLVNIKIAGKWMFIPLKMVLIGIDPYPYLDVLPSVTIDQFPLGNLPLFSCFVHVSATL